MEVDFKSVKQVIVSSGIDGNLDALEADTTFESVGIDSLDTFNLLLVVEEAFGVKLPEEEVEQFNAIGKIVAFISEEKAKA